jgi:DNA-binding transcriptional ArsR family regulator
MSSAVSTSAETLLHLVKKSQRVKAVPIHTVFVQSRRSGNKPGPGPLAAFVRSGRKVTLDLYLLAVTMATAAPFDVAYPAGVWARALGIGSEASAASAVSKHWNWLEEQKLVERVGRRGRWVDVRILREDGSGAPYQAPLRGGTWFKLPLEYWTENWYGRLSLPAKAVLLIGLSLADDFLLPQEKGPEWYGLSADTVGRGISALAAEGLITFHTLQKPAPLAPLGFTVDRHYTLLPPFGPRGVVSKSATGAQEVS